MGAFTSRRNGGVEEVDISTTNAYRYPPKSGSYFGSHYIMGGERFETTQPEAYLFGENQDLNFLGNRPVPFPYPAPQAHEPTKTLKSLVNIRKDSVRFVKAVEDENKPINISNEATDPEAGEKAMNTRYNIEFTFDSDVRCAITVYYFATEEVVNKQLVYHPKDPIMNSETFHYKRGANQTFNQATHIIDPSKFPEEEWQYNPDKELMPVVIHCVVEDEEYVGHSHVTFSIVEKSSEGAYSLKPLKQKQMVDGLCYLLQEIYGIENKNTVRGKDDDLDDNGSECVICMCETRDTIILPCRHLCLCNCCADNLRYQANNCPICRAPFRALLQIRAMRKKTNSGATVGLPVSPTPNPDNMEDPPVSQEGVPTGYEAVSLIEALNGPTVVPTGQNPLLTQIHPDGENPGLDSLLAGNSTLRSTASSLPTSPDDSPDMEKRRRRSKRQGSQGSQRRRCSAAAAAVAALPVREPDQYESQEERENRANEDENGATGGSDKDDERLGTPEVCMTEPGPDPDKDTAQKPQKMPLPTVKYPSAKAQNGDENKIRSDVEEEGLTVEDSLHIVDEVSAQKVSWKADKEPSVEEERSDCEQKAEEMEEKPPTPIPDYEEEEDIPEEIEEDIGTDGEEFDTSTPRTPAAHTTVLYDSSYEADQSREEDMYGGLPSQLHEPLSLPGTPAGGDGSSYSSTNSSHGLLQISPAKAEATDDRNPVA